MKKFALVLAAAAALSLTACESHEPVDTDTVVVETTAASTDGAVVTTETETVAPE